MRSGREMLLEEINYPQFRAEARELVESFPANLYSSNIYYLRTYYKIDQSEPLPRHMAGLNPKSVTVIKDEGVGMEFGSNGGEWLMYAGKTRLDSEKLPFELELCFGKLVKKAKAIPSDGRFEEVSAGVWFVFAPYRHNDPEYRGPGWQ